MTELDFRNAVVTEAKTWLGTPYHHLANIKGAGVDCAMILVEIYSAVGAIEWFDPRPYEMDWHQHQNEEKYLSFVIPKAREITKEEVGPGDVILARFGRTFSHSAIVIDYPTVMHAYIRDGGVSLCDINHPPFKNRELKYFTLWDKK